MLKIAITGGIAAGKSLVGEGMARRGIAVCDADTLAHEVMRPGTPVALALTAAFGRGIVAADGSIDRRALGRLVFRDERARQTLNATVHPAVRRAWADWIERQPGDAPAAAVIVPLLYEIGAESGWSAVVCVIADEAVRTARLRERGLSGEEARLRMAAQMPQEVKAERADFVIVNNGSQAVLGEQTTRVVNSILEK